MATFRTLKVRRPNPAPGTLVTIAPSIFVLRELRGQRGVVARYEVDPFNDEYAVLATANGEAWVLPELLAVA